MVLACRPLHAIAANNPTNHDERSSPYPVYLLLATDQVYSEIKRRAKDALLMLIEREREGEQVRHWSGWRPRDAPT